MYIIISDVISYNQKIIAKTVRNTLLVTDIYAVDV